MKQFQPAIVSRVKILSHLNIAEKRLPQDGRIKVRIENAEVDIRVSVIPMLHGEAVVMRLLRQNSTLRGLGQIGMAARELEHFQHVLRLPHGIILVTGPTGSGKTSTLYTALNEINDAVRKIITVEDPVEYQLKGVNQIQVNEKAGLTFARGLRSILRHDPDVVLVGEIRDTETAQIAVQASLTGHLVFSTLHTNDAPGALTRLVDMGVEPYLVASSLEAVLAQRLVRVLCPHCKQVDTSPTAQELKAKIGIPPEKVIYKSVGCRECRNTGFFGRHAIFEWMDTNEEIRQLILKNASTDQVRNAARRDGMRTLAEDGWRLVRCRRHNRRRSFGRDHGERSRDRDETSRWRNGGKHCGGTIKMKIPSSKIQVPTKSQASNSNLAFASSGTWNLDFFWNLELGTWNFPL